MSPLNNLRGLGRDDVNRVRVVKAEVSSPRPCGDPRSGAGALVRVGLTDGGDRRIEFGLHGRRGGVAPA